MSLFNWFKRKQGKEEVPVEVHSSLSEVELEDEENNYPTESYGDVTFEEPTAPTDALDINYHGGVLAPTQQSKEDQYAAILHDLHTNTHRTIEETLGLIDSALREETDIYGVYARIEQQDIPLLALVALELATEEDIAAYQLHREREQEQGSSYGTVPEEENLELVEEGDIPEAPYIYTEPVRDTDTVPVTATTPSALEEQPTPPPELVDFFNQSEVAIEEQGGQEIPLEPVSVSIFPVEAQPPHEAFSQDFPEPTVPSFPLGEESPAHSLTVKEPVAEEVVFPGTAPVNPYMSQENAALAEPHTSIKFPALETEGQKGESATPNDAIYAKLFGAKGDAQPSPLDIQYDGEIEEASTIQEEKPTVLEENVGLSQLIEVAKQLSEPAAQDTPQASPQVVSRRLSEQERREKIQKIEKFKRQTVTTRTLYVVWEGVNLPPMEGYSIVSVKSLKDLQDYGLNSTDLLILTGQPPQEIVEVLPRYVTNLLNEAKVYRVVNLAKKPFTQVEVPTQLAGITKEYIDAYYTAHVTKEEGTKKKGFEGFADFLTNLKQE